MTEATFPSPRRLSPRHLSPALESAWDRALPLGYLPAAGWAIAAEGVRVLTVEPDRVCVHLGSIAVYSRVSGLWSGYGLVPCSCLCPDWNDEATRLLALAHLARLTRARALPLDADELEVCEALFQAARRPPRPQRVGAVVARGT